MCQRFNEWENDIRAYCAANGLDFSKTRDMIKCSNKDNLVLQYFDKNTDEAAKGMGLLDETPLPVVLWVSKTANGLKFEQTEYTKQYMS